MKKKVGFFLIGSLILLMSAINSRHSSAAAVQSESYDVLEELKLFSRAIGAVLEGYVEKKDARQLLYHAVKGMLEGMDPYTVFIDEEHYKLLQIDMKGEYSGLGAVLEMVDNQIFIKEIKPASAAQKAGLEVKDMILKVDSKDVIGLGMAEVAELLRGEAGTEVMVRVQRPTVPEPIDIKVIRELVEISAINDVRMAGRHLGYLRIDNFQEHTADQIDKAIKKLTKEGMKALIIDLRNNQGGLMTAAIDLASRFLPGDKKIVSVESRIDVQKKEHFSDGSKHLTDCDLIVLVNEHSASASEIFSAAIQDHKRGIVVGMKTYGKASVQSVVPLDDKTAMKLTTARYISPNGRVIDKVGIVPDEEVPYLVEGVEGEDQQTRKALEIFKKYR
ncbi:MAG: peptidase S41 [Candidatus Omnitrophica bacterium CG11_big_fil_rev_8_21_14_0_20_45_26]|uniref:Peptidase S41 n=1 Tax=Candidatus Abzuiibacterium crystallinum TaxID=1974748 RepID=A0A2H0LT69_9BACT|nr:MAG: peptidase S41 [Candidatus Omnitrophica bacterium CG11_big_fil_rev_8_21_14_0_20_45_26]PIW64694.1 MAG: peptidase S41 [Candidatus Omnitrophica bacterium CG12_big_fil_rev_8_21_14_0_65_45_16]